MKDIIDKSATTAAKKAAPYDQKINPGEQDASCGD